jgi:hypothetical protein
MIETPLGSNHVAINTTDTFVLMVFTPLNRVIPNFTDPQIVLLQGDWN